MDESGGGRQADQAHRALAFILVVTLVAFWAAPVYELVDWKYSLLVSESIIRTGSPALDSYLPEYSAGNLPYQLVRANGRIQYAYPHGSSLLSIPFVLAVDALGMRVGADHHYEEAAELFDLKVIAGILMAIFSCLVFVTARTMLPQSWSMLIALATAFGTQIWSTAGKVMWSHTWQVFLTGFIVLHLVNVERGARRMRPVLLATMLSWTYFVRPTSAPMIACVTIYFLLFYQEQFLSYAITGALWFASFVGYSLIVFGSPIPEYFHAGSPIPRHYHATAPILSALANAILGNLVSPGRGLFVYVPSTLAILYVVFRFWRWLPNRCLAVLSLAVIVVSLLAVSAFAPDWWGGWSYGARYMTDTVPWFALLAILASRAWLDSDVVRGRAERVIISGATTVLVALSVAMNGYGAMAKAPADWNRMPTSINEHPERNWNWRYPQFLAGIVSPR